jgi:hypothetical protein
MADAVVEIPCIKFPNPSPLKVTLPFGVELKGLVDISAGPPTDCTLVHSLMLQLAPALAGLTCFFKVLNVIAALKNISVESLPKIAKAAADLGPCLNFALGIPLMIADILRIIIAFLKCFIESVKSVLNFQVGIDLNAAEGNPVLLASLKCAQANSEASLNQLMQGLEAIQPLLDMVSPLLEMGGLSLKLPSLGDLKGAKDLTETLDKLESTLVELQNALDSIGL